MAVPIAPAAALESLARSRDVNSTPCRSTQFAADQSAGPRWGVSPRSAITLS
jgi:hypothetical protein